MTDDRLPPPSYESSLGPGPALAAFPGATAPQGQGQCQAWSAANARPQQIVEPVVRPLNIRKKHRPPPIQNPPKEKPSWYAEAGLEEVSSASSSTTSYGDLSLPPSSSSAQQAFPPHSSNPGSRDIVDAGRSPPPPFTEVDPGVLRPRPLRVSRARTTRRVEHTGYGSPPSRLTSSQPQQHPPTLEVDLPSILPSCSSPEDSPEDTHSHRSLPPPRKVAPRTGPRPCASFDSYHLRPSAAVAPPRMGVNPTLDSGRSLWIDDPPEPDAVDPREFYNPAVSGRLYSHSPRPSPLQPRGQTREPLDIVQRTWQHGHPVSRPQVLQDEPPNALPPPYPYTSPSPAQGAFFDTQYVQRPPQRAPQTDRAAVRGQHRRRI